MIDYTVTEELRKRVVFNQTGDTTDETIGSFYNYNCYFFE